MPQHMVFQRRRREVVPDRPHPCKKEGTEKFIDCDTITGAKSDHTAVAAIMQIASFIPRKQNHRRQAKQGNQTAAEEEEEKKTPIPVDWEANRSTKSDKINDALNKHINKELHKIDRTWYPGME
jgi:hypothetical protein